MVTIGEYIEYNFLNLKWKTWICWPFSHNIKNAKVCYSGVSIQNCVTSSIKGWDQRLELIKSRIILKILLWNNEIKKLSVCVKQNNQVLNTWVHV